MYCSYSSCHSARNWRVVLVGGFWRGTIRLKRSLFRNNRAPEIVSLAFGSRELDERLAFGCQGYRLRETTKVIAETDGSLLRISVRHSKFSHLPESGGFHERLA